MTSFNTKTEYHLIKKKKRSSRSGYVYYAAFLNPAGQPKYLKMKSTGQTNKNAARKVAEQWISQGIMMPDGELSYLAKVWTPDSVYVKGRLARGRSMSLTYINVSKRWIEIHFLPYCEKHGITQLSQLDTAFINRWVIHLWEDGKIGPVTVNKVLQAVKVSLGQAARDGLIPSNPARDVEPVAAQEKERGIFTLEEYEKLFSEPWDDFAVYAACYLAATTAMRLGEIRGLLVKNLDLEKGVVHIRTSWQDNEGLKPPKWNSVSHEDGIPLMPGVRGVLQRVVKAHRWGTDPDNFVFWDLDTADRPLGKDRIIKSLYAALKRNSIDRKAKNLSFHSFRHTMITNMKDDPRLLRHFARHKQERITERYIHLTQEDTTRFEKTVSDRFSFAG